MKKSFEKVKFTTWGCLKAAGCLGSSLDPGQMLHSEASDLGLHYFLRPAHPNT